MNWIAIANSPLVWFVAALVLFPIAARLWLKGEAVVVGWLSARGDANEATLAALIGKEGANVIAAIAKGKTPEEAIADGKAAILVAWSESHNEFLADAERVAGDLITGKLRLHVAAQNLTGITSVAPLAATASNMPDLSKPLIGAILLLACLLPFTAKAQIAPGAVPDHWEAGILVPGLKFSLAGASPAAVGAGSGVGFSYLFGKYLYTTKQIDPVTKAPVTLPWFGVTFFAQGDVSVLLSGTVSENENAGVGAGLILLNSVTLGWFVDLVSVGSGVTSGLFTNHLSLSNTGPEIFYSVNLGAL